MGSETALLIATAISAAGSAYSANESANVADKQQSIINNAAEENAKLSEKKANTIEDFAADTFDPQKRGQRQEQAITRQEDSLVDTLKRAAGGKASEIEQAASGNLSSDYVRAKGEATSAAASDIMQRARLAARNAGSSLLFNDESLRGGQLSSDIAGINSSSNRNSRYAQNALGRVRDNGSLVGGLLQASGGKAGSYAAKT